MKYLTRNVAKEIAFVTLLVLGIIALAQAQEESDEPSKMRIEIEITEDGKTTTTVKEISIDDNYLQEEMDEMLEEIIIEIEDAVDEIEDGDLEVIVNRKDGHDMEFFAPHMRYEMRNLRHPRHPRHMRDRMRFEHDSDRPFLGVVTGHISTDNDEYEGAKILRVVEESGASEAGLQEGDIILSIYDEEVSDHSGVAEAIRSHSIGDEIQIKILREGKEETIAATLGEHKSRMEIWSDDDEMEFHNIFLGDEDGKGHAFKWHSDMDERKVFLGIEGKTIDEDGVEISKVFEGSTAEAIGLKEGDRLLQIDDEELEDIGQLVEYLKTKEPGDEVKVKFERDGKKMKEEGEFQAFPEDMKNEFKFDFKFDDDFKELEELEGLKKRFVYRFQFDEVDEEEIEELNKNGADLDASNSLEMDRFMISPNPSEGIYVVDGQTEETGTAKIKVLDANGRLVLEKDVEVGSEGLLSRIDLTDEESGVYFVSIEMNGKGKISKVIKQ